MTKVYKFPEMTKEHRKEITANLGTMDEITLWEYFPKFPTATAATIAEGVAVKISERRVKNVITGLKAGEKFRPILIDELDEQGSWVEGIHRTCAAVDLGLKTIPAFVRKE